MSEYPSTPPPGWYADPYGTGQLRFWDGMWWTPATAARSSARPLEDTVDRMRGHEQAPWGWRVTVLPCVAIAVVAVFGSIATRVIRPHTFTGKFVAAIILNLAAYGLLAAAVWIAGHEIAARYGGWGPTFGLRRPTRKDIGFSAAGIGVAFVARLVVSVVASVLSHGRAGAQSQNIRLQSQSVALDVLLVVVIVLLAPTIEEVIFRGLLLRAFMRRLSFWPAALASTFIFAAFHTYEVDTLVGAATLAAVVATLGLTNCVLVRLTDRLTPGIFVHATLNALAATVIIYQASH